MKPFKIQISVIIYLYDNHYIFSEPKMARGQIRKMYVKLGSFPPEIFRPLLRKQDFRLFLD